MSGTWESSRSPVEAVRYASVAGALVTLVHGALEDIPTAEDVASLVRGAARQVPEA